MFHSLLIEVSTSLWRELQWWTARETSNWLSRVLHIVHQNKYSHHALAASAFRTTGIYFVKCCQWEMNFLKQDFSEVFYLLNLLPTPAVQTWTCNSLLTSIDHTNVIHILHIIYHCPITCHNLYSLLTEKEKKSLKEHWEYQLHIYFSDT